MTEHKHILGSGWIRDGHVYRECVGCRTVLKCGTTQVIKSDYNYYKEMAKYYGV